MGKVEARIMFAKLQDLSLPAEMASFVSAELNGAEVHVPEYEPGKTYACGSDFVVFVNLCQIIELVKLAFDYVMPLIASGKIQFAFINIGNMHQGVTNVRIDGTVSLEDAVESVKKYTDAVDGSANSNESDE